MTYVLFQCSVILSPPNNCRHNYLTRTEIPSKTFHHSQKRRKVFPLSPEEGTWRKREEENSSPKNQGIGKTPFEHRLPILLANRRLPSDACTSMPFFPLYPTGFFFLLVVSLGLRSRGPAFLRSNRSTSVRKGGCSRGLNEGPRLPIAH
ncbi:hypothetical protein CDAR_456311 [Caerostris darwini]|uniref:Uncharacterized protein n=1 Tax=Caerostris darwini TaxID=1538125 RepID=A0AAV4QCK6_9ARAC|nr:hypothetical protein CDAR_456311 [Caerostris darwini]